MQLRPQPIKTLATVPVKQQWERQSQLFESQGCNFGSVVDVEHYYTHTR